MARQPAPDTRDRILDTAARLFYEHGVRAVGMQQIVEECGCGKSLLYREFASKDDLVVAYLDRFRRDWAVLVADATRTLDGAPAAQLVVLAGLAAAQVDVPGYRGCAFRNCYAEFPADDNPAGRVAAEHLRGMRTQVEALAGRTGAADPDTLARRVWLVLEGLYASAAHPGGIRADDAAAAVAFVAEIVGAATPTGAGDVSR